MIAFSPKPLGLGPIAFDESGTLLPNGTVQWPLGADTVLSVQADGSYQTRPKGTAGPYEQMAVQGANLVYQPTDTQVYVIPFVRGVR